MRRALIVSILLIFCWGTLAMAQGAVDGDPGADAADTSESAPDEAVLEPEEAVLEPESGAPVQAVDADYRLGPGDRVEVRVLGEPDLSAASRLGENGTAELPVLGAVPLAGRTVRETREHLTGLLTECCLTAPEVVVQVTEYRAHSVEVLGSVAKPGPLVLTRPTRLLEVLSQVGGLAENASSEAVVTSKSGDDRRVVDLHALLDEGRMEHNLLLQGGDVLFVPKVLQVSVTGEVKNDTQVPWAEGLTVVQAISMAGGLTDRAAPRRVQIIRVEGEGQRVFRVNLTRILKGRSPAFVLEPEDTVWVPRSAI